MKSRPSWGIERATVPSRMPNVVAGATWPSLESALQNGGAKLSFSHSMQVTLLKSKIHRAAVTGASLHYEGSLTVSADIAEMVGLLPYEKILVGNLQNGERFETYVIYGAREMGLIELNGATAHLGAIGDRLTIMSFARLTPEEAKTYHPRVAVLDAHNRVVRCEDAQTKVGRTEREMAIAGE
jgi:aspartate 1-decarboxylase